MGTGTHNSDPGGTLLERHCKMQVGGTVGKDLLKWQGAKSGILHCAENLELDLQWIEKYPMHQAMPTQVTGK